MISKQRCLFFFVGDRPFKDLKEAQKADLIALMPESETISRGDFADWMIANARSIVDTLTTTPTSRLRARKTHGATKRRVKLQPANV